MRDRYDLSTALLHRGRFWLVFEPRDLWIGLYIAPRAVYIAPLPCLVIKWERRSARLRAAQRRLRADALAYGRGLDGECSDAFITCAVNSLIAETDVDAFADRTLRALGLDHTSGSARAGLPAITGDNHD